MQIQVCLLGPGLMWNITQAQLPLNATLTLSSVLLQNLRNTKFDLRNTKFNLRNTKLMWTQLPLDTTLTMSSVLLQNGAFVKVSHFAKAKQLQIKWLLCGVWYFNANIVLFCHLGLNKLSSSVLTVLTAATVVTVLISFAENLKKKCHPLYWPKSTLCYFLTKWIEEVVGHLKMVALGKFKLWRCFDWKLHQLKLSCKNFNQEF